MTAGTLTRADAPADEAEVRAFLLRLGVALTMTGDAVSEIEERLRAVATAYGYRDAHISVFPTVLMIALHDGEAAAIRTIDTFHQLRLDQASEVIGVARRAETAEVGAADALDALEAALALPRRFSPAVTIAAHAVVTLGLGLVIHPAPVDLSAYVALGALVGALRLWAERFASGGYLLAVVTAALVSAIAFLAHGGNEAASLRLVIPPLTTFLPGALLTMGTVDLAMGETVTGASRFVAGLLQLALLAIGIVVGAEIVGDPHTGPVAGASADHLGAWAPWVGVALFGAGIFVYQSGPRRGLPWLLIVLFSAWIGQLAGKHLVDATLSGFVGAAAMVPVAHLVARVPDAPPSHVTILPAFWLLVPGTIGLIGLTELVGDNTEAGSANLGSALVSIPSVALGILVGTMLVRAGRLAQSGRPWHRSGHGRG